MATKRQLQALSKRIKRIEDKLAKKRDEVRDILAGLEALVAEFEEADETIDGFVLNNLREAREELDRAADQMSRSV